MDPQTEAEGEIRVSGTGLRMEGVRSLSSVRGGGAAFDEKLGSRGPRPVCRPVPPERSFGWKHLERKGKNMRQE